MDSDLSQITHIDVHTEDLTVVDVGDSWIIFKCKCPRWDLDRLVFDKIGRKVH